MLRRRRFASALPDSRKGDKKQKEYAVGHADCVKCLPVLVATSGWLSLLGFFDIAKPRLALQAFIRDSLHWVLLHVGVLRCVYKRGGCLH